jgi:hypothetical protein
VPVIDSAVEHCNHDFVATRGLDPGACRADVGAGCAAALARIR